jgi:hypothetical protein
MDVSVSNLIANYESSRASKLPGDYVGSDPKTPDVGAEPARFGIVAWR